MKSKTNREIVISGIKKGTSGFFEGFFGPVVLVYKLFAKVFSKIRK